MYIYAGRSSSLLHDMACYDINKKEWKNCKLKGNIPLSKTFNDEKIYSGRYGHTMNIDETHMYIFGGATLDKYNDRILLNDLLSVHKKFFYMKTIKTYGE